MTEDRKIEVKAGELAEIRRILAEYLPDWEVRAFGSRVTGQAKPWSDLDLAVVAPDKIDWNQLGQLTEAFQESSLPFRVDVLDWNVASPAFRKVIEQEYAVVQPGQSGKLAH